MKLLITVFACGFVTGIGFVFVSLCVIALCRSAKSADMCRQPEPSQEAFEPAVNQVPQKQT